MRKAIAVIITVLLWNELAFSQGSPVPGFDFRRDCNGEVTTVQYYGDRGLRTVKLHDFPKLNSLMVIRGTTLTADDLDYLSSLNRLEGIHIGNQVIDPPVHIEGDLAVLGRLKSLEWIHLCKSDIKDADLKFVASLPRITELDFNADFGLFGDGSAVTDDCARYLCRAKTLEGIFIWGHGELTDEFVSAISDGLPNLEYLHLCCPALTDASLAFLAQRCEKLNWLNLSSNQFTDQGIQHLSTAVDMEMLWIDSNSLTFKCIESVAPLRKLKHLGLTVPTVNDTTMQILADLEALEIVALRQPRLTDSQFQMFQDHPKLESAFLNGENMTIENTVRVIATIPNLNHLSVGDNNPELQAAVNRALKMKQAASE